MKATTNKISLVKQSSTADRVATILREQIMSIEEDSHLGSESDVAAEVGVSLPTLRQAARMLEYEELLTIKPGKGGGYFTRRPSIETAIKSASQFLSPKNLVDDDTFMAVADPIMDQILVAAVNCKDKALVAKLERFVEEQRSNLDNAKLPPQYSFALSTGLITLLAEMSGNILLELIARILWNEISVSRTYRNYEASEELLKANYTTRLNLAESVLSRDKDKALRAWKKRSKFLRDWPPLGTNASGK